MIIRQGIRFSISGPVNFGNVRKLLAEGLAEIENGAVEADLSKVEGVDSSAIGMMLEWLRAARRANRSLAFLGMSRDLESLARLYGLSAFFRQEEARSET